MGKEKRCLTQNAWLGNYLLFSEWGHSDRIEYISLRTKANRTYKAQLVIKGY
jgi:hypothetical protein